MSRSPGDTRPEGPQRPKAPPYSRLINSLDVLRKARPCDRQVDGCVVAYRFVYGWGIKRVRRFSKGISLDDARDIVGNSLAAYLEKAHGVQRKHLMADFDRHLDRERKRHIRYKQRAKSLDPELREALEGVTPQRKQHLDDVLEKIFAEVPTALDSMNDDYHDVIVSKFNLDHKVKGGTLNPTNNTTRRALEQFRDRLAIGLKKQQSVSPCKALEHALIVVTTRGWDLLEYAFACSDGHDH